MKKIVEIIKNKLSKELFKEIKDKDVATYLNMNPQKIALLKTRNSIPYQDIIKLCEIRQWDLNEIFLEKNSYSNCDATYKIKLWNNMDSKCTNKDGSIKYIQVDKTIIDSFHPFGDKYNVEAISYTGDSMKPTIGDEATIFIDCNIKELKQLGIFVIHTINGLLVKRIVKNHQGSIDIISDNSIYPLEKLKIDEFTIIGRVLGTIARC